MKFEVVEGGLHNFSEVGGVLLKRKETPRLNPSLQGPNVVVELLSRESDTMKFRYAMVCSSNQNRSMEAHALLKRQGFDVSSYGTGSHVKLPGPSLREPNVYDFGTPYKQMLDELRQKDPELYPSLNFFFNFFHSKGFCFEFVIMSVLFV